MVLTTYSDSSAAEFGAKKAKANKSVDIWAQWLGTLSIGEQEEVIGSAEQAIVRTRYMLSVKPGSTLRYKDKTWEVVRVAPEGDQFNPKMMRMYVQSQEARSC